MKWGFIPLLAVIAFSCGGGSGYDSSVLMLEGLRTSVADAKRDQHTTSTELEILEDRINRYEQVVGRAAALEKQVSTLTARLQKLERQAKSTEGNIAGMKNEISSQLANMKSALQSVVSLAKASQTSTYTVRSGDTLERIAGRERTSVAALLQANSMSSDRIIVGQKLVIP